MHELATIPTCTLLDELKRRDSEARMPPPPTEPAYSGPRTVTQEQFCAMAGIRRELCRQLRDLGYIPYAGAGRVHIPVRSGMEGLEMYTQDYAAGQIGRNAKYKRD